MDDEDNNGNLEVIPTTEDKEMQIEYHGIQFKDLLKLISSQDDFLYIYQEFS